MTKGERIALLVAEKLEGCCGPFGGESPDVEENILRLSSQGPDSVYRFNDDGSVDVVFEDEEEALYFLIDDCGLDEEEAREEIDNPPHYESLEVLSEEDSWFMDLSSEDIEEIMTKSESELEVEEDE